MPNKWRTIKSLVHKIDFTVDEGKELLNPSREKDKGTHRRRKVEKSCVTPAGASTSLTSRINGMTTHTRTHTRAYSMVPCIQYTVCSVISLSPFAPENLISQDGFGSPVPRQPAHLHTQAEFGAYLRDPSRVPRRRIQYSKYFHLSLVQCRR